MKKLNQNGSVLIGVLLTVSIAAFVYVSSSTSFFNQLTKQKSKSQLDIQTKALTNAVFSYTSYAIKERWCMDENWGRDQKCGGAAGMSSVVGHPRNLERFLWSKATLNDMSIRYEKTYGSPPKNLLSLSRLEQIIPISKLETLGVSHPLNLVMEEGIKECLTAISIIIEKPLSSYYKPQGDEVYLLITVKGILNTSPLNRCTLIKQTPVLKSLVILYPKTLNQYALIKADDFNVSDFASSTKGLDFFGPVYIQKNLILPSGGTYGVSFKEKVRIGEGLVKKDGEAFKPFTPGGMSDQYLTQITTLKGIMSGISLEAEVDEGLPRLFGEAYSYPSNVNMASCTNRKALKDDFSLTKNSRLWIKGSAGAYTFALSESNEFREYMRNGTNDKGLFIYNTYLPSYTGASSAEKNIFDIVMTEVSEKSKPIMEVYISIDDRDFSKVLLGRDSQVTITLGKKDFFQNQKNTLDISNDKYLDLNKLDIKGLGIDSSFKDEYVSFEKKCSSSKSKNVEIPECIKVDPDYQVTTATDCNIITKQNEKEQCLDEMSELTQKKSNYFSSQEKLISNLTGFIANIPSIVLKTSSVLSNKEDVQISFVNQDSFKYPFVSGIDSIKFNFKVYDFGIEESNNTTSGLRAGKNKRLPGPNEAGVENENIIDFIISKDKIGNFEKIKTQKNDGKNLDSLVNSNWGVLKKENKSYNNPEPPGNFPSNPAIRYPVDGISVADAQKLDEVCNIDVNAIPPANWDVSFTENTQFSWLYNVTGPGVTIVDPSQVKPMPSYTFTKADMDVGNYQGVPTRSIVKECIVPSSIDFVFGFYVCETLKVSSRGSPLNFVGTFIVKNLKIDNSALSAGVSFYSIWSTGGIQLLRDKKHLRREKSSDENCIFDLPGWYTGLDEDTLADFQSCSPAKFLYQGANNFNWTTVDPEIGISGTETVGTTQSKVVNRYRRFGADVAWIRNGVE